MHRGFLRGRRAPVDPGVAGEKLAVLDGEHVVVLAVHVRFRRHQPAGPRVWVVVSLKPGDVRVGLVLVPGVLVVIGRDVRFFLGEKVVE